MRLLIINTLPKEHLLAEKAICRLEEKTAECKTFYITQNPGKGDSKRLISVRVGS